MTAIHCVHTFNEATVIVCCMNVVILDFDHHFDTGGANAFKIGTINQIDNFAVRSYQFTCKMLTKVDGKIVRVLLLWLYASPGCGLTSGFKRN